MIAALDQVRSLEALRYKHESKVYIMIISWLQARLALTVPETPVGCALDLHWVPAMHHQWFVACTELGTAVLQMRICKR